MNGDGFVKCEWEKQPVATLRVGEQIDQIAD